MLMSTVDLNEIRWKCFRAHHISLPAQFLLLTVTPLFACRCPGGKPTDTLLWPFDGIWTAQAAGLAAQRGMQMCYSTAAGTVDYPLWTKGEGAASSDECRKL